MVSGVQNVSQSTYLLFASVLCALHRQPQHPLAAFYPILAANAEPPDGNTDPLLVDFVGDHVPEISDSPRSKPLNRSSKETTPPRAEVDSRLARFSSH